MRSGSELLRPAWLQRYVWETYETFADGGSRPGPSPPTCIAYCN